MAKSSPLRHTWILGAHEPYETNTIKHSWNKDLGVTRKQWLDFNKRMSHLIIEELLTHKDGFELPLHMGILIISGNEGKPVNKLYSNKDKTIRFRNNHTGEKAYTCHYLYGKERGKAKCSPMFDFKASGALRRKMYKKIMEGEYEFYEFKYMDDVKRLGISLTIPKK